jgi:hypothetical protein
MLMDYFHLLSKEELLKELGDWYSIDYLKDDSPGVYRIKNAEELH